MYERPDRRDLRTFGLTFAAVVAGLFGCLLPWFWSSGEDAFRLLDPRTWPAWPWLLASIVGAWALLWPATLHWLHRPWMKFAELAGWLNTRIILVILFYVLIVPMGLLMRLFGHDPMRRGFDPQATSYRVESKPQKKEHMKVPY